MILRYYIAYRKILKNGNTRTYRREFKSIDKALEYARDKMYDDTCINDYELYYDTCVEDVIFN